MWNSLDGGITWDNCDTNVVGNAYAVHPDHHQTLFHPITGYLFDCNDGGVNYSSDLGATWTSISTGLVTHQFYSIAFAETDAEVVIGGCQDVGTFTSSQAHGGKWRNDFSGDSFGHLIDHSDEATWYGTAYINRQRVKSTDSGLNWNEINTGTSGDDQWRMPYAMHPDNNNVLLSSNDNFMYKTTNGGASWSTVSNAGFIGGFVFDEVNPSLVYAHELFGSTIYRSSDGGDSWFALIASPGSPITDLAVDPSTPGRVYATIGSFSFANQVFVSPDSGQNWTNISMGLPEVPANTIDICDYDSSEIYVGTDIGVWVSETRGQSWYQYGTGLPAAVVVEDLHYYAPDGTVRIGTYGRGYWRADALTGPPVVSGIRETVNQPIRVHPNPSPGIFQFDAPIGPVRIFDQQGRLIITTHATTLDLTNHSSGVYEAVTSEGTVRLVKE